MKGVVFCEFLEMVDTRISPVITEKIISESNLPSKGAYTTVGTYDHSEIVTLVSALSQETGVSVPELVHTFGYYLFGRFSENFSCFFEGKEDAFTFLESIDSYIHVEVRKLYPEAELPEINCERSETGDFVLHYKSEKGMGDLAHGLIKGCVDHFNEKIEISRHDISGGQEQSIRFELRPAG